MHVRTCRCGCGAELSPALTRSDTRYASGACRTRAYRQRRRRTAGSRHVAVTRRPWRASVFWMPALGDYVYPLSRLDA